MCVCDISSLRVNTNYNFIVYVHFVGVLKTQFITQFNVYTGLKILFLLANRSPSSNRLSWTLLDLRFSQRDVSGGM